LDETGLVEPYEAAVVEAESTPVDEITTSEDASEAAEDVSEDTPPDEDDAGVRRSLQDEVNESGEEPVVEAADAESEQPETSEAESQTIEEGPEVIDFYKDGMAFPARGFMADLAGQGYRKTVRMDMDDPAMFKKLFQEQIIDAGWIQDPSTLAIIISFFIYNPNTYLAQEKKLAIEFLTPGLFINLEHSMSMVNTKLYRNDAQTAVSTIAIVLGFVLVGLSLY